jgi:hypothetical protein
MGMKLCIAFEDKYLIWPHNHVIQTARLDPSDGDGDESCAESRIVPIYGQ